MIDDYMGDNGKRKKEKVKVKSKQYKNFF